MVNPLARVNMKNNLKDQDQVCNDTSNVVANLDSKESNLIQRIIKSDIKSTKSRVISLDEAVERIKNSR